MGLRGQVGSMRGSTNPNRFDSHPSQPTLYFSLETTQVRGSLSEHPRPAMNYGRPPRDFEQPPTYL